MKIKWNDDRMRGKKYITNAAFKHVPGVSNVNKVNYTPTFTLAEEDEDGLLSMERLFIEHYMDPTEHSFIEDVFDGDEDHWNRFKNSMFIRKYYQRWKRKAEAMLLSSAMTKLVETAFDSSNRNSFSALKYLIERGNKEPKKAAVGRPKKDKEEDFIDSRDLLADIARLKE